MNHGTVSLSVSVPAADLNTATPMLTAGTQTVSATVAGCAVGSRLLLTPQDNLPGSGQPSAFSRQELRSGGGRRSAGLCNGATAVKRGSVTVSYEIIR